MGPERITCVPRVHFRRPFTPNSLVSRFGYCFRWFPSTTLFLFDHRFFDFVRADFIFWIFNFFSSLIDYGVFVFYSFIFICLRFWVLFDFVLSFACCHVYLFLISGFIYSFPPFKSIYWSHLVDCCAVTLMLICIYIDTASSPHVFQVGCIRLIICARYERLRPSNTLRGLSNHNIVMKTSQNVSVEHWQTQLHGFHLRCVEITGICLSRWEDLLFVAFRRNYLLISLNIVEFGWFQRSLAM